MKRILAIIAAVILIVLTTTSCRSSYDCPAYGETHKYQNESRY